MTFVVVAVMAWLLLASLVVDAPSPELIRARLMGVPLGGLLLTLLQRRIMMPLLAIVAVAVGIRAAMVAKTVAGDLNAAAAQIRAYNDADIRVVEVHGDRQQASERFHATLPSVVQKKLPERGPGIDGTIRSTLDGEPWPLLRYARRLQADLTADVEQRRAAEALVDAEAALISALDDMFATRKANADNPLLTTFGFTCLLAPHDELGMAVSAESMAVLLAGYREWPNDPASAAARRSFLTVFAGLAVAAIGLVLCAIHGVWLVSVLLARAVGLEKNQIWREEVRRNGPSLVDFIWTVGVAVAAASLAVASGLGVSPVVERSVPAPLLVAATVLSILATSLVLVAMERLLTVVWIRLGVPIHRVWWDNIVMVVLSIALLRLFDNSWWIIATGLMISMAIIVTRKALSLMAGSPT